MKKHQKHGVNLTTMEELGDLTKQGRTDIMENTHE
jgi:hypothetical protein